MNTKILIVSPSWVGDIVMSQTLLKVLKQQVPNSSIDLLAPKWSHDLILRMEEVDQVIEFPFSHGEIAFLKRYRLGKLIRENHYDLAIVLPNSFKSALVPFFARIPKRVGFRGEWRYGLLTDVRIMNEKKYPLMIERFMALGFPFHADLPKPYPSPTLRVDLEKRQQLLRYFNLHGHIDRPILALCPGAQFGSAKRWPAEYYGEVARQKLQEGWGVLIFGAKSDVVEAREIQSVTGDRCVNLVGLTHLSEVIDLLSLAKVVISNDSGLMHIASALHLPLIALYGSTSPNFTPPLSRNVKILSLPLSCRPCFERECPLKHFRCMLDLMPSLVLKAINELVSPL